MFGVQAVVDVGTHISIHVHVIPTKMHTCPPWSFLRKRERGKEERQGRQRKSEAEGRETEVERDEKKREMEKMGDNMCFSFHTCVNFGCITIYTTYRKSYL